MKTTLFTIILSLFTFIATNATLATPFSIEKKEDIDLNGKNNSDREKTLVTPFQAWLVDNEEVEVLSYHTYADVTINICTISGQMLDSQTLSFASMQSVTFNISNFASGCYQVKITTPTDKEYTGLFIIE